ncbi:rRNA maturation RNase YbeY [Clostridium botulinum C]|uniref:Endoribonuclease YbeY n=2 Tax=Clostridium botulinum TaxID=1491 RepID=A0A9Q4TM65_CLOBO|nr:rRNA maturation RNase YbeY [Clostridium botulinum]EGO86857.1 heat-shock protein [Clostridium botulinum C str. Stockholm]MCD3196098.1 rRNA maturation RNase YbeY [Clostridium botulinum C]MCD3201448.1 rRNA maturation RNase YbeY [Clostridium botulinum C]MCD3206954.1 rRNA maturation RNase YbeY [Clostridium botulinum C]MCD3209032.1 rRNA maturation RNase YbeY [Clostridium botulinum C]
MIYIDNRQDKINIDEKILETVKEIINYTLKEEEVKVNTEVSVIFIDNNTIKEINKETRDIDKVTDVLSFPMLDYPQGKVYKDTYKDYEFDASYLDEGELVLGDIVLSLEKAEEQSTEFRHSFLREVCYLTVHSVLHLLGYDHMEDDDKIRMRKREEEILERFSITR